MLRVTRTLESGLFKQAAFLAQLRTIVTRNALRVEAEAKRSIQQGTKSGRLYRRRAITKVVGARKAREFSAMGLRQVGVKKFVVGFKFHRASAPGQAPATDTGNLVNTILARPAQMTGGKVVATVTVNADYGRVLEEKLNRPYLAPATRKIAPRFDADIGALLAHSVR